MSTEPMDANSGEPWSEMDISDLTHSLDYGTRSRKQRASCAGTRMKVRQKAKELGLVEQHVRVVL